MCILTQCANKGVALTILNIQGGDMNFAMSFQFDLEVRT